MRQDTDNVVNGNTTPDKHASKSFSSASSDKLFLILEYVAQQADPIRLQDIASALAIPQPTVLRYMNSLLNMGYVYKDEETLRYLPTFKICRLSHRILSQISIRDFASPELRILSRKFGCGATVARVESEQLLYLDVIYHPNTPFGTVQRIGNNAPVHVTGSGKLYLSTLSSEGLKKYVERNSLVKLTPNSITSMTALKNELQAVRQNNYAIDDEECETGIRCVSAPLFDYSDHFVAAISLFASVSIFDMHTIKYDVIPYLAETAISVSRKLGANCTELSKMV